MKAVKIISAVILVLILLVAESFVMGIFSVDKAVSRESVNAAMEESDVVSQLVEEALMEETVNSGGEYGEMIDAVFRTESMNVFLSDYMTAVLNNQLYGDEYEEIGSDELMQAFSAGIDEVNQEGTYSISAMEGELLKQALQQTAPDLTKELNSQISEYDSLEGETASLMTEGVVGDMPFIGNLAKGVSLAVTALICAGIIMLCWSSKLGFLWCSIVTALISAVFAGLYHIMGGIINVSATDRMIYIMMENGFGSVYMAGFIAAAIFMAAFIILKIIFRNKKKTTHDENISYT